MTTRRERLERKLEKREEWAEKAETRSDAVYIAGPMTGKPDFNRPAFMDAERYLIKRYGCRVLNPAHLPDGFTYRQYMTHALLLLSQASAIVALPESKESVGASFELFCAMRDGLPRYELSPKEEPAQ